MISEYGFGKLSVSEIVHFSFKQCVQNSGIIFSIIFSSYVPFVLILILHEIWAPLLQSLLRIDLVTIYVILVFLGYAIVTQSTILLVSLYILNGKGKDILTGWKRILRTSLKMFLTIPIQYVAVLIGSILIVPGIIAFARFSLSGVCVASGGKWGPLALKQSWKLTKSRTIITLKVFGAFKITLAVFLLIIYFVCKWLDVTIVAYIIALLVMPITYIPTVFMYFDYLVRTGVDLKNINTNGPLI